MTHDDVARRERAERAAIVAKHRELESVQQDALGATCTDGAKWSAQHCAPSCYPPEPTTPRAHLACQRDSTSWLLVDDELTTLDTRALRKRAPKRHKRGTWQSEVESALPPKFIVTGTSLRTISHPLTHESLRCVQVSQYGAAIGACGIAGKIACEASGDTAARALNLVHYRIAEAGALHRAGNDAACQTAALEAIATARGMPRWRQYAKLNVGEWPNGVTYKTRLDGLLDEDALFARVDELGREADALYATCGGASVKTTPQQEHAFHSCP